MLKAAVAASLVGALLLSSLAPASAQGGTRVVFAHREQSGAKIVVYSDGLALQRKGKYVTSRYVGHLTARQLQRPDLAAQAQADVLQKLRQPQHLHPYVENRVLVVFGPSAGVYRDTFEVPRAKLVAMRRLGKALTGAEVPQYSGDLRINRALAKLGADRVERIFKHVPRSQVSSLYSRALSHPKTAPKLDISYLYRVHVTNATVVQAVRELADIPGVAYVEPDWRVSTMLAAKMPIPKQGVQEGLRRDRHMRFRPRMRSFGINLPGSGLPQNFGIDSSLEGQMTAPADDAVAAYDEVERTFRQLPGQGVNVTNISVGLLTGTEEKNLSPTDPCLQYYMGYGPTTRLIGGQRYIDWPGMPLIPTYVADAYGDLSGSALACGPAYDAELGEIGLDFSMMAPLPDDLQRSGARTSGQGLMDLLGIAPGATYRLVVPGTLDDVGNSDLIGAFLAAAMQTPAPDVITASLGFGTDSAGFPGRYLEDDLITESTIATIVNASNVVVCISANDGLRQYTNAAFNPSGGSTPTNLLQGAEQRTSIWDIGGSTAPSYDPDSGAIDVGGTTLDDISAANPLDPASRALANVRTFAETRWTGAAGFSSGMGSRVNISAPSDNVLAMYRCWRADELGAPWPYCYSKVADYDTVEEGLEGGTSAAAPEVAAAAAVAIQVARLTGHPFGSALAVRNFLVSTATPVASVPQADTPIEVGPQLNLRRAVETLLARGGRPVLPSVATVDVMHRQSGLVSLDTGTLDNGFLSDTDPGDIDLAGPIVVSNGEATNDDAYSPITIAPAWEGVPPNAHFRLYLTGKPTALLSTHSYARLYPAQILAAAGDTLTGAGIRNVSLTYVAYSGLQKLAQATFTLGFGPMSGTQTFMAHAPFVAPVSSGTTVAVTYDISNVNPSVLDAPRLVVSYPGRANPDSTASFVNFNQFIPLWSAPLTSLKGTINVPISALRGGGIYGIGILLDPSGPTGFPYYSDFAYTRVSTSSTTARPAAPLLALTNASQFGHSLTIPYNGSFSVQYDVANVPGASGAILEFADAGPTIFGSQQTFNNPNGTGPDDNGKDTGSVAKIQLYGTSGTVTVSARQAHLRAALMNNVRLIATRGGVPVGEDGDVSTIAESGIAPSDGGNIAFGFDANASGSDGLYTSTQVTASSQVLSSAGVFSQANGNTIATEYNGDVTTPVFFGMPGFGMFPSNDTGFFGAFSLAGLAPLYQQLPGLSTNPYPFGQNITMPAMPDGSAYVAENGTNYSDLNNAMAVVDPTNFAAQFFSFSQNMALPSPQPAPPLIAVPESAYQTMSSPGMSAFDYDSGSKTGYMVIDDTQAPCGLASPALAAFNYATSGVTTQSLSGAQDGTMDFAIDAGTHVGALATYCQYVTGAQAVRGFVGLQFVNLNGGSIQGSVTVPGIGFPASVAVDPANHLVLAELPYPDDLESNENAESQIYVMDERGNVREKLSGFSFIYPVLLNHFFSAGSQSRTGFIFGPPLTDGSGSIVTDPFGAIVIPQIMPFSY